MASVTEAELLETTGEDTLEDITDLSLRERGLCELPSADLLRRLSSLEVLSLSHNRLSSLGALATSRVAAERLTHLNVSFNAMISLSGLEACHRLTRLYASNNRVRSLAPLASCTELEVRMGSRCESSPFAPKTTTANAATSPPFASLPLTAMKAISPFAADDAAPASGVGSCWSLEVHSPDASPATSHVNDRPWLAALCVYKNALSNADETIWILRGLPSLREMNVAGNPLARDVATRHRLVHRVTGLTHVDGEEITATDRELALAFFAQEGSAAETFDPTARVFGSGVSVGAPAHRETRPGGRAGSVGGSDVGGYGDGNGGGSLRPLSATAQVGLGRGEGDTWIVDTPPCGHSGESEGERLFRDDCLNDNPILIEYLSAEYVGGGAAAGGGDGGKRSGAVGEGTGGKVGGGRGSFASRLRNNAAASAATEAMTPGELAAEIAHSGVKSFGDDGGPNGGGAAEREIFASAERTGATPQQLVLKLIRACEDLRRERDAAREERDAALELAALAQTEAMEARRLMPACAVAPAPPPSGAPHPGRAPRPSVAGYGPSNAADHHQQALGTGHQSIVSRPETPSQSQRYVLTARPSTASTMSRPSTAGVRPGTAGLARPGTAGSGSSAGSAYNTAELAASNAELAATAEMLARENKNLRAENANMYATLEDNKDLRRRLADLERPGRHDS